MNVQVCTHCNRAYSPRSMAHHQRVCLGRVRVYMRTQTIIRELAEASFGCIPSQLVYDRAVRQRREEAGCILYPSSVHLVRHFGSWPATARHFGLLPRSQYEKRMLAAVRKCVMALSRRFHGGKVAPSRNEYETYREEGLPVLRTIWEHTGLSWQETMATWGLPMGERSYYAQAEQERSQAAAGQAEMLLSRMQKVARAEAILARNADTCGLRVAGREARRASYSSRRGLWKYAEAVSIR